MAHTNLYEEIVKSLSEHDISTDEIEWVGLREGSVTYGYFDEQDFLEESKTTFYNNGYGGEVINLDLVVVGKDWWLERHEYDGAEWFEFKTMPYLSTNITNIKKFEFEAVKL